MTRRALLALFAFFFGRKMPQPNQYTVSSLPYTYNGTLDESNPDQTTPENYYNYAEDQFFLPLVVGQTLEFRVDYGSYDGFEFIIWDYPLFPEWSHYVAAPELLPSPLIHEYFRWTVPSGVPPTARLSITKSYIAPTPVDYTLTISVLGSAVGGGTGSGYGAF